MSDKSAVEQSVCRLITIQRGIVGTARNLDEELKNGDLHEEKFSSGEFLQYISLALDQSSSASLVDCENYILSSFKRVLNLALEYHEGIASKALADFAELAKEDHPSQDSNLVNVGTELKEKISISARRISLLRDSLVSVSDDHFTDQVETGMVAINDLIKGTHAAKYQLATTKEKLQGENDRDFTIKATKKSHSQNRWMIIWGFAGFIVGITGIVCTIFPNAIKSILH